MKKSLSILNVYRTYYPDPPGGLQEAIRQICLATSAHTVKNSVFTLSPSPNPRLVDLPEARVLRERSWVSPASCDIGGLAAFRSFANLSGQSDLIHYFHPWPFADVLNIVSPRGKPKVLTYISDVVRQRHLNVLYSPLMWKNLHDMDVIVANCPAYAQTSPVLSHPSIRDRVRIIPLGIDETSYPSEGDDGIFVRASIDLGRPYFLFLGVHRYYKGIHSLVDAASRTRAQIVLAGHGPKTDELKAQVLQLGLTNVTFTGQVTEKEKISLFRHCRAFVLPSHMRSEAYGMVLVEASMMSKPMISCEIGTGTSYINLHEQTGFVMPPESPHRLAEAINALDENESLALGMGKAARQRYELLFSGDALGKSYADLYRELV